MQKDKMYGIYNTQLNLHLQFQYNIVKLHTTYYT